MADSHYNENDPCKYCGNDKPICSILGNDSINNNYKSSSRTANLYTASAKKGYKKSCDYRCVKSLVKNPFGNYKIFIKNINRQFKILSSIGKKSNITLFFPFYMNFRDSNIVIAYCRIIKMSVIVMWGFMGMNLRDGNVVICQIVFMFMGY